MAKRIRKVLNKVDKYLDNIKHKDIVHMRTEQLYNRFFHDISSIVIKTYDTVDVTQNTELNISMDRSQYGIKILVTGYVKVDDGFIQIEKTYYPEGYKDE